MDHASCFRLLSATHFATSLLPLTVRLIPVLTEIGRLRGPNFIERNSSIPGKQLVSVLFSTKNRTDTNYPGQVRHGGAGGGGGIPAGKSGVLQPIMPLDLPVKVRPWELTVYPRSHIRR
jgi:hypothetical protein